MPEAWLAQLFEKAFVQDPRPDLPARVGLATPFGAFGLMDYMVGTAESVGEGLVTLSLFFHLISDTVRLELERVCKRALALLEGRALVSVPAWRATFFEFADTL